MPRSASPVAALGLLAVALLGAACGGDDDPVITASSGRAPSSSDEAQRLPGSSAGTAGSGAVPGAASTSVPGGGPVDEGPVVVEDAALVGGDEPALEVRGQLPTPCHRAEYELVAGSASIGVRLYSVVETGAFCAQVVEPFTLTVPLGPAPSTPTAVTLNGEDVGSIG